MKFFAAAAVLVLLPLSAQEPADAIRSRIDRIEATLREKPISSPDFPNFGDKRWRGSL
jgi:hypothetical protein